MSDTNRAGIFLIEYNNSYSSGVLDLVNNKAPQSHLRHAEKVSLRLKKGQWLSLDHPCYNFIVVGQGFSAGNLSMINGPFGPGSSPDFRAIFGGCLFGSS